MWGSGSLSARRQVRWITPTHDILDRRKSDAERVGVSRMRQEGQ